jgi:hypothetical protein
MLVLMLMPMLMRKNKMLNEGENFSWRVMVIGLFFIAPGII